jgi:RHS repeat-associated protein
MGELSPGYQPSIPIAEAITPQIQALADGLQDNPTNIFNYVHDHIKFELYFGSKKGANLTLLERSGNDFDQCALLTALLSAAGYSNNVQYQFGWQVIPYSNTNTDYDLQHWWQLTLDNTNWTNTVDYVFDLLFNERGYPTMTWSQDGNTFEFQRVWVQLTTSSGTYELDPAFKISTPIAGISLTNAIGDASISNSLFSAAMIGGTDNGTYAQNLDEAALRSKLTAYSTSLLNFIQSNSPNATVQSILGGSQIVPANDPTDFTNSTRFPVDTFSGQMPVLTWTYEPTNLMSTLGISFAGTNYQWLMPQLQGDRLSLTYGNNGVAQLWQDDALLAQGSIAPITNTFVNYLETPFSYGIQGSDPTEGGIDQVATVVYTNCTAHAVQASSDYWFYYITVPALLSQPITNTTTVTLGGGKSFTAYPTTPYGNYYLTTLTNEEDPSEYVFTGQNYTGYVRNMGDVVQSNQFIYYPTDPVTISITHPVGNWDTTNNVFVPDPTNGVNMTVINSYESTNSSYAIIYAFEPDWSWLQQREQRLDQYLTEGLTNNSRQVTCETLNIMGLSWMLQTESTEQMLASQLGILPLYYHRIGRMAQEAGRGYYVDVYMQMNAEFPNGGWDPAHTQLANEDFDLSSFFHSSLEYGLIEQLQNSGLVAASTVKMLEIGNTNHQPIYLANSANWPTITGDLTNYSSETLDQITTNYINNGYYVLLLQNGYTHLTTAANSWAGYGFEARQAENGQATFLAMAISGNYLGGYDSDPTASADPQFVDTSGQSQQTSFTQTPVLTFDPSTGDPVDTADGTFQVENTDLSLGQAEPKGISLSHSYNGTRRFSNPASMADGWIQNYYIIATNIADPQACLGGTTPQQATAMLTATASAIALYNGGSPDPGNWVATALVAKWGVDQLTKSGVSVTMGKDTLQFVQAPNGVFVPPANCTANLTGTPSAYTLQMRHGNTFTFTSSELSKIVDPYQNQFSLTYSGNRLSQVTDWHSRSLQFKYNSIGQLTNIVDSSGRSTSYGYSTNYNPQGDLVSYTDANGNKTTYAYDSNHDLTATIDAQSRMVVSNAYNSQGQIKIQCAQGDTNKKSLIYWSGYKTTEFDPAGDEQSYLFDDQGRLIAVKDALGNVTRTIFDGQNHVVETVSPLNETNQYFYDGNNNITNSTDPLGFPTQYIYDASNNLVETVDPLGNPTLFSYNTNFSVTAETNGAGNWKHYAYNPPGTTGGTLASSADAGGTNTYSYDTWGQLDKITYWGTLGSESFVNSVLGDVTNHTDGRGFITVYKYNALRQLTNTVAPTNVVSAVAYDPEGNTANTTDVRGNVTSESWSATRKLLTTTLPSITAGTPVITNNYDNRDWLIGTFGPLQSTTTYTNDPDERLISKTDPAQRTITFNYDNDGRKLSTVNAASETNSQTWDAKGELISLIDGFGDTSIRGYDHAGNQIVLTNRNGYAWHFYFDGANRLTNTVSPLGHSTMTTYNLQGLVASKKDPIGNITTYAYDAKGRLKNRSDSIGTTIYRYDPSDNQTNITENGLTNTWTYDAYNRISTYKDVYRNLIQYRYDTAGNLTNLIYPSGKNVYYSYDSQNHLTKVTDWSGRVTSMTYDLNGRLTGINRPNGTSRTIAYDAAGEATNVFEQTASGTPIAWFRYNWNPATEMGWEFAAPLPHVTSLPTRQMLYDPDNQLQTVDTYSVSLDADGNLLSGPLTNDTFATYTYDARNRLTSAAGVTNVYDAANNRIGQFYGTNSVVYIVNPNAKLPYVLMRIKSGITNYYVYGPGLLYQVTEQATGTNTLTYHYDTRGSTIALTDNNGNVRDRIEYSLYATLTYRAGTDDTPFLFDGRFGVMSDPSGLLYMRARYYSPFLCRFLNPDPSGFSGGMNFYAYANGNPVTQTDPYGLWAGVDDLIATGGGALLGLAGQGVVDLIHGQLSGWQSYVAAAVGGAAGGEATLYSGPGGGLLVRAAVGGAVGAFIGNTTSQGLDIATGNQTDYSFSSAAISTGEGAAFGVAGGYIGSEVVPGALSLLSNSAKGNIGEGLSLVDNLMQGNVPVGSQVNIPLPGTYTIADWQFSSLFDSSTIITVESKFGTSGLTPAQTLANQVLPNYQVERWTYDWLGQEGNALGAGFGAGAASGSTTGK